MKREAGANLKKDFEVKDHYFSMVLRAKGDARPTKGRLMRQFGHQARPHGASGLATSAAQQVPGAQAQRFGGQEPQAGGPSEEENRIGKDSWPKHVLKCPNSR